MKDALATLIQTAQSLGPILGHSVTSGQLLKPQCDLFDPDPDVLCEYGVEVPSSEGFKMTANVFRSRSADQRGEKLPIIMCAHPYDNRLTPHQGNTPLGGAPQQYRLIPQTGRPRFSTLTSWESPDPDFWVRSGYAVVNLNLPGYGGSGGPPSVFSRHQARAYHDAIEHFAAQPWSTGRIGLNGVSFLAISQYYVAAGHGTDGKVSDALAAISPWEGLSNPYRDVFGPGGVAEEGFPAFWWTTEVKPALTGTEDDYLASEGIRPTQAMKEHPTIDAWWREKTPDLSAIRVPMLVCASFSDHNLHTVGSFRAFEQASSEHKWAYTHRHGKWDVYYSPEVQELTRQFMDCFVKGERDNGFLDRPPVRLEVRSSLDKVHEVRNEPSWPIERAEVATFGLTGSGSLSPDPNFGEGTQEISATKGEARFVHRFAKGTEITGSMALELVVSLSAERSGKVPTDCVIFAYIFKKHESGAIEHFRGSVGSSTDAVARGYGRAAMRALDTEQSTVLHPVLRADVFEPVEPGATVRIPVHIYPSSTWFEAGSSLELLVATHEAVSSPPYRKVSSENHGRLVLHFGGDGGSVLRVPMV